MWRHDQWMGNVVVVVEVNNKTKAVTQHLEHQEHASRCVRGEKSPKHSPAGEKHPNNCWLGRRGSRWRGAASQQVAVWWRRPGGTQPA